MTPLIGAQAFHRQWSLIGADVEAAVREVGGSGWYILGEALRRFETALAGVCGRKYAAGCGNGLDAIEIALRALGLRPGEKVLTTPMSAFATTLAIHRAGGRAVFVDVDAAGLLDLEAARRCLAAHPEIRFCIPVHLYGFCLDLPALARLRDDFGLTVIEDGAQALGAGWKSGQGGEMRVGDVGRMLATSFYPTKNLGALGDGGAVLTDDEDLLARARCLRDYGQTGKYVHAELGMNSRLDELQAAIMHRAMLPRWAEWGERRRAIAQRYLAGIDHPLVAPLPEPAGSQSVWHLFPVLVSPVLASEGPRDGLIAHLRQQGILAQVHYPVAIPDQPALAGRPDLAECFGELPLARRLAACEVSLPITPDLEDFEVDRVIEALNGWRP